MRHSDAFKSLFDLTLATPKRTKPKYYCIAIFLTQLKKVDLGHFGPIEMPHRSEWITLFNERRDPALQYLVKLRNNEWALIKKIMLNHSETIIPKIVQLNWVSDLDTLRAFS